MVSVLVVKMLAAGSALLPLVVLGEHRAMALVLQQDLQLQMAWEPGS